MVKVERTNAVLTTGNSLGQREEQGSCGVELSATAIGMPQDSFSLLPFLLALLGYAIAGLNIWPSLHIAFSNASVFVDFSSECNSSTLRNTTLSLVDTETNSTLLTRSLPNGQSDGRIEFNCSCFLYAGTFRFYLKQTSIITDYHANSTDTRETCTTSWWWSSELQVQWPTFHIAVDRAGNHSGSFQVGISTNEHFQACSGVPLTALFLEVSYMEYNQIGRNSIDKVRTRTRHPIKPLRTQSIELPCAFPFTEKDFIRLALRSPHTSQEVKSSGPLYLSRIFSYKLLVDNTNAYRTGCEGTMTVKLITPPCAHVNGKVLLYQDRSGSGVAASSGMATGGTALVGFGAEEPSSPPLAFNWLTQGENETEFNCSVFYPGRNKYCFRFVFNFSRSPSPAQTCLVVYRSVESWGQWLPWSACSVSCGEGVRERVRECLLPSGGGGMQCTGMVKEQSLCSLDDCAALPSTSPSVPPVPVGVQPLDGNVVAVAGISLCLAVILATVLVTVWRKFCRTPQCSSVHRGSVHSPEGRKLSDVASICGHSLQRPSLADSQSPPGGAGMGLGQKDRSPLGGQPLLQPLVVPVSQDPDRLSPTGQKLPPPIFGYRLAHQQLKEMKKKGLKEATLLYHVSSSPVQDTLVTSGDLSPTNSPAPTSTGFTSSGITGSPVPLEPKEDTDLNHFCIAASFVEPIATLQTSRAMPDRLSPRVELILGPLHSSYGGGGSGKRHDRTADWVEMVGRSGLGGLRGRGEHTGLVDSYKKNPNFRRTFSFHDTPLQSSTYSRQFRERSMTQVGSRTLPEGSCRTKGVREGQPFPPLPSYPLPGQTGSDWIKSRPHGNDQRPWAETAAPRLNSEIKHMGTNTDSLSKARGKASLSGTREREGRKSAGTAVGGGGGEKSGIGGPPGGPISPRGGERLVLDRAEQNWSRRGPSPIQRNILARKLKEAQASGHRGRQRSSTFSVSSSGQSIGRSLPMSREYSSSGGSPYGLSEAEQRMLDLDLPSAYVEEA